MYDLPKAAHFDVYINGELVGPLNDAGLKIRWRVANSLRGKFINMMSLSYSDKIAIENACSIENERLKEIGVVVQLKPNA